MQCATISCFRRLVPRAGYSLNVPAPRFEFPLAKEFVEKSLPVLKGAEKVFSPRSSRLACYLSCDFCELLGA